MMIVVAIIGILASIATPAFIKYVKQSKTTEATVNLKTMGDGASSYYQTEHFDDEGLPVLERQFPGPNAESKHPASVPAGTKTPIDTAAWQATPWFELNFSVSKPHYYQYAYQRMTNSSFSARAKGDLDGDGTESLFVVSGVADASGEVSLSPTFAPPGSDPLE
jgi:type II secretory pathway pseudopilin PulG